VSISTCITVKKKYKCFRIGIKKSCILMHTRIFPRVLLKSMIRQLEISLIISGTRDKTTVMYVPPLILLLLLPLCAATTITRLVISIVSLSLFFVSFEYPHPLCISSVYCILCVSKKDASPNSPRMTI